MGPRVGEETPGDGGKEYPFTPTPDHRGGMASDPTLENFFRCMLGTQTPGIVASVWGRQVRGRGKGGGLVSPRVGAGGGRALRAPSDGSTGHRAELSPRPHADQAPVCRLLNRGLRVLGGPVG